MPEQTTEQKKALFKYRTDPTYKAIIDTLVHQVANRPTPDKIRFFAALDFFITGMAMVADPDEIDRPNCNPFDFDILPDGRAKYTRPVPTQITEQFGEPILDPDQFVVLQAEGQLPTLRLAEGETNQIEGWEPWVEAWKKVEPTLDAFLVR